jgi:O-antigen ligase
MGVGYFYGIIRANIPSPIAQFVYDAALAGLFLAALTKGLDASQRARVRSMMPWVICLIGWPTMLLLVPSQNLLIQLVGWRGNVLFVPFILIGALLNSTDMRRLAQSFALLNSIVLAFALAEVILGVPRFYPFNAVDAIIYKSTDVTYNGVDHFRIPATFTHAAAYATCMVASIPLLIGALGFEPTRSRRRYLLLGAAGLSALGVFLAASRSEAVVLMAMAAFITIATSARRFPRAGWLALLVGVAIIVVLTPRMQRFFTLADTGVVSQRLHSSVNSSVLGLIEQYPLGNGLGGGGTSIPYFLKSLVRDPVEVENEYGRIVLEQGIPGLLIWVAFILRVFVRSMPRREDPWYTGRWLARIFCAISFATAPLGTGLLNAIPQSALVLMFAGWIATARTNRVAVSTRTRRAPLPATSVPQPS